MEKNTTWAAEKWTQMVNLRNSMELPIDVEKIAHDLGAQVAYSNFKDAVGKGIANELKVDAIDISGMIEKKGNSYIITINKDHPKTRQRFTIAHELGHFILHKDKIDSSEGGLVDNILFRAGSTSVARDHIGAQTTPRMEAQANQMAADILMPFSKILEVSKRGGGKKSIEEMAQEFKVSTLAMAIRLDRREDAFIDYYDGWVADLQRTEKE
ncbi:MAG: ImmA/IrrE family metallo-endopeptidase [Hydrotalea sp.]|nr:ImmA/IrrE family metallo-endopeptidase [Hydrotalea sp.]